MRYGNDGTSSLEVTPKGEIRTAKVKEKSAHRKEKGLSNERNGDSGPQEMKEAIGAVTQDYCCDKDSRVVPGKRAKPEICLDHSDPKITLGASGIPHSYEALKGRRKGGPGVQLEFDFE